MSVYFIVQEKILDPDGIAAYGKAAQGAPMWGRALVVDDNLTPLEGEWHGERLVILEFEDEAAFREWYDSPQYQAALPIRLGATDSRAVLAKGLG